MTTKKQTATALPKDWLYDAVMETLLPDLASANVNDTTFHQREGEARLAYEARLQSYEKAFSILEEFLNRLERSYVARARQTKDRTKKTMHKKEKLERENDLQIVEHLFRDLTS